MGWGGRWALDDGEALTGPGLRLQADGNVFDILFQVLLLEYVLHRVYVVMLWFRFRFFWELLLGLLRWWRRRRLLLLLHLSTLFLHSHQESLDLTIVWTQPDGLVQVL